MRVLSSAEIAEKVYELCQEINFRLRADILAKLRFYLPRTKGAAKYFLKAIIDNARVAKREKLALCQDTGMVVIFLELGKDVAISGNLIGELSRAVEQAYRDCFFRASIVKDAVYRGKPVFGPPIIHVEYTNKKLSYLTVLAKGFGSENKSKLFMLLPTDGEKKIIEVVLQAIKEAGADACPPFVVGVGIGGTADKACYLSKKAITLPLGERYKGNYPELAQRLLAAANKLNIGPLGLGGEPTVLGVNILSYPTHIAGLPVAVNIGCHSTRSKTIRL